MDGGLDLKDYSNFTIQNNRVLYNGTDVLIEEIENLDSSLFTTKDNIEFIMNSEGECEVSSEFFRKFEKRLENTTI